MKTAELQAKNQPREGYLIFADPVVTSPRLKKSSLSLQLQTPVKVTIPHNGTIALHYVQKRCSVVTIACTITTFTMISNNTTPGMHPII